MVNVGGDRSGLLSNAPPYGPTTTSSSQPHSEHMSQTTKVVHLVFVGVPALMVFITLIISIVKCATVTMYSGVYLMLGLSVVGLVVIEIITLLFIRNSELPPEKSWFLYVMGIGIIFESVFTDVLLFQ